MDLVVNLHHHLLDPLDAHFNASSGLVCRQDGLIGEVMTQAKNDYCMIIGYFFYQNMLNPWSSSLRWPGGTQGPQSTN